MAGTTSVPAIEFTPAGLVIPVETDVLAGVQADMNAAFGGNLNQSLATPQGQLASSQAAIIADKNAKFALFVNQIDPATADGFMQDAVARIYFLDRLPALSTTVDVVCSGLNGVVIPAGALVADQSGNKYAANAAGTIASGSVTINFSALVAGPTNCPAGAIAGAPYQAIIGWDSATNIVDGVTGRNVEGRADFEYRRKQSVAINGRGSLPSIYANVFAVDGVLDVYVAENTTGATITLGATSYPLIEHSIYVGVVGGLAADIAQAIWLRKDVGADYNGNTSVTVTDPSGYSIPYPTYVVKFNIPTATPIKFAVQLANSPGLPSNIVALVKAAIVSAFNGGDGGARARIGATIFASRYYAPVSLINANVSILSLLLGPTTPTLASSTMGIDQVPTIDPANISVTMV